MDLFNETGWKSSNPQFFENDRPTIKPLSSFAKELQGKLIVDLIETMGLFYGGIHHFLPQGMTAYGADVNAQFKNLVIPAWRSGLGSCSIAQILSTLFLVLEGKTPYVDFPPSTVIKFKALCGTFRPGYHDLVPAAPPEAPKLGYDKEKSDRYRAAVVKSAYVRSVREMSQHLDPKNAMKGAMETLLKRQGISPKELDNVPMSEYEQKIFDEQAYLQIEYSQQIKDNPQGRITKTLYPPAA